MNRQFKFRIWNTFSKSWVKIKAADEAAEASVESWLWLAANKKDETIEFGWNETQ